MILSKMKRLMAYTSKSRFIRYLRGMGVVIGEYTEFLSPIHSEVDLGWAKYISIGDHCILCSGIRLIAHDYSWKVLEDAYGEELPSGGMPIHIGNNVFVGANCTILGGVSIGNNVIIAAGSMVCKSLPDNTVCAGTPAKVIKSLDAYYQKRKETYVTDAKKNAQYIWSHTGKLPVMDEMINFAVLFMPRTAENIQKYILRRHRVGGNAKRYAEILQDTEQLYPDYRAFLVDALGEDVVKREMKKDFPKE